MSTSKPWTTLSARRVVVTPRFSVRLEKIALPGGEVIEDYVITESPGWVAVFCVTRDRTVVLNQQYKHGIGEVVLELPAGAIEEGESPEAAALRELEEEAGYVADRIEFVRSFIVDPTGSEARMHLFCCFDAVRVSEGARDPREPIVNRHVSLAELRELVADGQISVAGHVAAICTMLAHPTVQELG